MAGQLTAYAAQALANTIGAISGSIPSGRYIALLTADPSASGPGGGYAMNVSDLVEDLTSGYARQAVTFTEPPTYGSGTTYTLGQQVFYNGFLYQCAVNTVTGTAPPSTPLTSNATWTYINNGYPATISNTAALTFGPYSAAQALPVNWAALVTSASGTTGNLLYFWTLPAPEQVANSKSIQIPAGLLTLSQG